MSNDGAWLMISTWIILNVSWATSTIFFGASHTGHGSFRDNSECISCITQPKYDHFWFWVVWHPRNIWIYLDNMQFSSMQWWWSSWWMDHLSQISWSQMAGRISAPCTQCTPSSCSIVFELCLRYSCPDTGDLCHLDLDPRVKKSKVSCTNWDFESNEIQWTQSHPPSSTVNLPDRSPDPWVSNPPMFNDAFERTAKSWVRSVSLFLCP